MLPLDRLTGDIRRRLSPYHRLTSSRRFQRNLYIFSLSVAFVTTIVWSVISAHLQQQNADELADPALFTSWSTFHAAHFPGQHTQLIKWPLFWLIGLGHGSATVSLLLTVFCSLVTVGTILFVLQRIESRPNYFSLLCIALSSCLLLVPAQPYAGGLLPVNWGMVATRNLEYVMFVAAALLLLKAPRLRSRHAVGGLVLLSLLFASDKLFVPLAIGGGILSLAVYSAAKQWRLVTLSVRWLLAGICSLVGATLLLALLGTITHIDSSAAGTPYGFQYGLRELGKALFYSVYGLLTSSGANPGFDAQTVGSIPSRLAHHILNFGGLGFIVNFTVIFGGCMAVVMVLRNSLRGGKPWFSRPYLGSQLAVFLSSATFAATTVFMVTKHQHVVDSRYLGIGFFTLFVGLAAWLRTRRWKSQSVGAIAVVLMIGCLSAVGGALQIHGEQAAALRPTLAQNMHVAQAMHTYGARVLVGDYWRVLPIRQQAHTSITAVPLSDCTTIRRTLSSDRWSASVDTRPFVYLLSLQKGLTDFPACSIDTVVHAFGQPNSSQVVGGSQAHPTELLLFYDNGRSAALAQRPAVNVVKPLSLSEIPDTSCSQPTSMNIVAHEDDDLLFMNPDVLHDVQSGRCVRTVYLTAGDAGRGDGYWHDRERGAQAAYARMLGIPDMWQQYRVRLSGNTYLSVSIPAATKNVSLLFMRLPDGDLQGDGFRATGHETLAQLQAGTIDKVRSVDGQSVFHSADITNTLAQLMNLYQPSLVRSQSMQQGQTYRDHSDHGATGTYAASAVDIYRSKIGSDVPLLRYLGYPVREQPADVNGDDAVQKQAAFLAYAAYDASVCQSVAQCKQTPTYGAYLKRQYVQSAE